MVAFAGRYGKADPSSTLAMSMLDLRAFNDAVSEIVAEEAEATRRAGEEARHGG
jgi:hypothetical protein